MKTPGWVQRSDIAREFWERGRSDGCPVIDAHAHMGSWKGIWFPNAEPDAVVRRMDRAGVERLVFSHHAALSSPDVLNDPAIEAVRAHPGRLHAYYVFHPGAEERCRAELAAWDRFDGAFVGLKLHGDMHGVPYTDPRCAPAWEFAERHDLPVLVHTWGGSIMDGEGVMRTIAERYPGVTILLGHSLHNDWDAAIRLAKDFPRVHLELCAVLDERSGVLERFVAGIGSERVFFGTDMPWFDFHSYIAAVLAADITDEDRRNILHGNARRLFGFPAPGAAS